MTKNIDYAEKQGLIVLSKAIAALRQTNTALEVAAMGTSWRGDDAAVLNQLFLKAQQAADSAVRELMAAEERIEDFYR